MRQRQSERTRRLQAWLDQRAWVDEHGGTLAGYVARYGSAKAAEHYGSGGEAIYAADVAALDAAWVQYQRACGGNPI